LARVLVTRRLPAGGLDPLVAAGHELVQRDDDLPFTHDELVRMAPEVDAIVCLLEPEPMVSVVLWSTLFEPLSGAVIATVPAMTTSVAAR